MGQKKRVAAVLPILLLALGVGTASASVVPRDTSDLLGSPAHSHPANGSAELFKRQHSGGADYCKMPDGRQICGPLCGSCPEGSCCRGTDMTWVPISLILI